MTTLKIFPYCLVFEKIFLIKINIISTAKSPSDSTIIVKIQTKWSVINYSTSTIIVKIQIKWWFISYCKMSK